MLCGLERCFPKPLIRQIYPSLPICVFSQVFDFENVGRRESTLRNRYVAEALCHPFLQALIGTAIRAVEVPPHFDTNRKSASNEAIRPGYLRHI
ncbi:MAG: transcriptional regulator of met regulon [Planctomycetaceae bacterium]|jgi:transcriptional regulator of met regulon